MGSARQVVLVLLFGCSSVVGGCGSTPAAATQEPGPPPQSQVDVAGTRSPTPHPPDKTSESGPETATEAGPTTRVEVSISGEVFHMEIRDVELVTAAPFGPATAVRCTIRLCREDGSDAGPAMMPRGRWEAHPEGWSATFQHGERSWLTFLELDSGSKGWRVGVTPELADSGQLRWIVTGQRLLCIR